MRNTTCKLFHEKGLKRLHDDLNICGIVRNHFLGLSMRYYRRYRKSLSYGQVNLRHQRHVEDFRVEVR